VISFLKIFRINATLFNENSNAWHSLAEGWYKLGEKEKALLALENGLNLNKDPAFSKTFLALQKEILTK
jgi:hypothetical protein